MHIQYQLLQDLQSSNDKIIIVDQAGRAQAVILSYSAYKRLAEKPLNLRSKDIDRDDIELTSDKFLDNINREIAQSEESQDPPAEDDIYFTRNDDNDGSIDWIKPNNLNNNYTDEERMYYYFPDF